METGGLEGSIMKITDKKIKNIFDRLDKNDIDDEDLFRQIFIIQLQILCDIRKSLKKPKVYKQPTNDPNDIIGCFNLYLEN